MKDTFYSKYIKRIIDILLSTTALIFLSPIFFIVYILVRVKLGSPVFFKQVRPGKDEKLFTMFKFRTMTNEVDFQGNLLSDEKRLTKFGKLLRSTSLDELPSILNILLGDMSIVGPRPLLVSYLDLYNDEQKQRHLVRPGLTGLAQISGRNNLTWEERFKLDVEYVRNVTFTNDVVIFFKTFKKVLIKEGISSETSSTMEPFEGSN